MKKILIYNSGGGLGDSIQLIPLILSLKNHYRSSDLYYLGAHENHFKNRLKEFNMDIKTLDLDIKYFGFRWWQLFLVKKRWLNKNFNKIDLIIDLQSKLRNTIILKKIPPKAGIFRSIISPLKEYDKLLPSNNTIFTLLLLIHS